MVGRVNFWLAFVLAVVVVASVGQITFAQGLGASPITAVPVPVPEDWNVYQEVNGAWWLKYPGSWSVAQSYPGGVQFQVGQSQLVEITVGPESFPLPYDNWLTLDLVVQREVQGLTAEGQDMQVVEVGRWFHGVFGLFLVFQGTEPQSGAPVSRTVVLMPFGENQAVRASFSLF